MHAVLGVPPSEAGVTLYAAMHIHCDIAHAHMHTHAIETLCANAQSPSIPTAGGTGTRRSPGLAQACSRRVIPHLTPRISCAILRMRICIHMQ